MGAIICFLKKQSMVTQNYGVSESNLIKMYYFIIWSKKRLFQEKQDQS